MNELSYDAAASRGVQGQLARIPIWADNYFDHQISTVIAVASGSQVEAPHLLLVRGEQTHFDHRKL